MINDLDGNPSVVMLHEYGHILDTKTQVKCYTNSQHVLVYPPSDIDIIKDMNDIGHGKTWQKIMIKKIKRPDLASPFIKLDLLAPYSQWLDDFLYTEGVMGSNPIGATT